MNELITSLSIAIVGGTGLETRLIESGTIRQPRPISIETPFGTPSAPIMIGHWNEDDSASIIFLARHGDGHTLPPHRVPYRANIFALKSLGVTHVLATGAVGSLREDIHPGEIVLCDQFIDRTTGAGARGMNRTFFDEAAVHVEFADPCCPVLRCWLAEAARRVGMRVHPSGTYLVIDGPSFSTRAESELYRRSHFNPAGADVVGMTALPEARLAREAEIAYAMIALPTDYDCWKARESDGGSADSESLLLEISVNLDRAADAALRLIQAALTNTAALRERSPAHDALKHAIWTDKRLIAAADIQRLWPIWGRHFANVAQPSGR